MGDQRMEENIANLFCCFVAKAVIPIIKKIKTKEKLKLSYNVLKILNA